MAAVLATDPEIRMLDVHPSWAPRVHQFGDVLLRLRKERDDGALIEHHVRWWLPSAIRVLP